VASAQKDTLKDYKAKTLALKKKAQASTTAPAITAPPGLASTLRNPLQEGVDSSDYYISYSPPGNSLALPSSKFANSPRILRIRVTLPQELAETGQSHLLLSGHWGSGYRAQMETPESPLLAKWEEIQHLHSSQTSRCYGG
jgi:hypothetical protein